jgi:hypothetical protein
LPGPAHVTNAGEVPEPADHLYAGVGECELFFGVDPTVRDDVVAEVALFDLFAEVGHRGSVGWLDEGDVGELQGARSGLEREPVLGGVVHGGTFEQDAGEVPEVVGEPGGVLIPLGCALGVGGRLRGAEPHEARVSLEPRAGVRSEELVELALELAWGS